MVFTDPVELCNIHCFILVAHLHYHIAILTVHAIKLLMLISICKDALDQVWYVMEQQDPSEGGKVIYISIPTLGTNCIAMLLEDPAWSAFQVSFKNLNCKTIA